ncbi:MAG TPA: hypothetical protein VMH35_15025 [Streptosporangiaceae bacterium]|nr:hypothetical protein [Streptosporangiaceae bacterium]
MSLPDGAARRLDEVSTLGLGFPHDELESAQGACRGRVSEPTGRRRPFPR